MSEQTVSLIEALRHDAEISAGVRHNEERFLKGTSYGEGVLKLLDTVEAYEIETMHKLLMERVPTGNVPRYSMHRSLWEMAKKQREAMVVTLKTNRIPPARAGRRVGGGDAT